MARSKATSNARATSCARTSKTPWPHTRCSRWSLSTDARISRASNIRRGTCNSLTSTLRPPRTTATSPLTTLYTTTRRNLRSAGAKANPTTKCSHLPFAFDESEAYPATKFSHRSNPPAIKLSTSCQKRGERTRRFPARSSSSSCRR